MLVAFTEQISNFLGAQNLRFGDGVSGREEQLLALAGDIDLTVAAEGVFNLVDNPWWQSEFRILLQRSDDLIARVPRGPRVPQPEPGDAVGVNVFGCPLQFGKDRQGMTRVICVMVPHFQQDRFVALDNEATVRIHNLTVY
jgi:hypothetical protein